MRIVSELCYGFTRCINHASYQIDEDFEACDACVYDPDMFSPSALRVSFASPIEPLASSRDKVSYRLHHARYRSSLLCLLLRVAPECQ